MNYSELEIVKSRGLSQLLNSDEEFRVLYFYKTNEDEGGVFCTPIFLTDIVANGWPDAGFVNHRAYRGDGDLYWWHGLWGYVIYNKSGELLHHTLEGDHSHSLNRDYKISDVTSLNFYEAIEKYFLRLNGDDVYTPKFDYEVLDDAFSNTFNGDSIAFGDHYYLLANKKITEMRNSHMN